jgi:hypothetical protein
VKKINLRQVQKSSHSKGQIITFDFILSLIIFIFLLIASVSYFANITSLSQSAHTQKIAQFNFDTLGVRIVDSPGVSQSWNVTDGIAFGLSDEKGLISKGKLEYIATINQTNYTRYEELVNSYQLLSLLGETYVFNGTHYVYASTLSFGVRNTSQIAQQSYVQHFYGTLDNITPIYIKFTYVYADMLK